MMRAAAIAYRNDELEAWEQDDLWTVRLANLETRARYLDLALAELLGNAPEAHRAAVNKWIRESGAFDGVADFDAALRDPEIPTQMRAQDDCGDGLHPSDSGYCKMGDVIDLALLD